MRIVSISAKRFRTLENFHLDFKGNYCALSGQNNAGKSAVVQIIRYFLAHPDEHPYYHADDRAVSLEKDRTQWVENGNVELELVLEIFRDLDSEVFFVVEKLSSIEGIGAELTIKLKLELKKGKNTIIECFANNTQLDPQTSSEILKKLRSASNLFVHNSTSPNRNYYFFGDGFTEILDAYLSTADRESIAQAHKGLQKKVQLAAKKHKAELSRLLGKLDKNYSVELTTVDRGASPRIPLQVKLTDQSVEVPLGDWGSGTQNRTRILMSVLDALRISSTERMENRSTPVVLIEEPECFLHPSAQAEFGKVLCDLAEELKIQIIVTTHSPYMLNQQRPETNTLLERNIIKGKLRETRIRDTSGENWMVPFADILGVIPNEFASWKPVILSNNNCVILVEGDIDKEYFEYFRGKHPELYAIDSAIEVVPYGGRDALKNTQLLRFMLGKFRRVFITYDLDGDDVVSENLKKIGLEKKKNFLPVGKPKNGAQCIEGLVPDKVKSAVYAKELDLVTALTSADTSARKSAKSALKRKLLAAMQATPLDKSEFSDFQTLFSQIAKVI